MKNIIINKIMTVPAIFFLLLFFKGGDLSAWIAENSNLTQWLESNKIDMAYKGADFSFLPAIAVIAGMIFLSQLIHSILKASSDFYDALTSEPDKQTLLSAAHQETTTPINLPDHQEKNDEK